MAVIGIDHVQVAGPVGCEAEARAFYGTLLGLAELPKPPSLASRGGCWFKVGQQELHVGVEEAFEPARKAHPGFVVDDLDELAERLTDAGAPVTLDELGDVRRLFVQDPFGNRLELRQG